MSAKTTQPKGTTNMKTRALLQVIGLVFAILLLTGCSMPAEPTVTPAPASTPSITETGFITGTIHLSAPPTPGMVVYAVDPTTKVWAFAETQATDSEAAFTISVPPGAYQVFGAVASGTSTGLGYSIDERTLAFVTVAANQTVSGINVRPPSQWACGSMFGTPASPDGRFAAVTVPAECPQAAQSQENQQTVIDGGRIQFQANTDTWYTSGELAPNQSIRFMLYAMQGQQMNVNLSTDPFSGDVPYAALSVTSADGSMAPPPSPLTQWNGALPASQDYYVEVRSISQQNVGYTVEVQIPAGAGPAPITPSSLSYGPVSAEVCQILQELASQSIALSFSMDPNGYFADPLTGETGKACVLTAMATGMQFSDPASVKSNLVNGFLGWEEQVNYQADGHTSSGTAMTRDMGLMLINVEWIPSPDANCPTDQPISACNLTPEQKMYTIQVSAAQK
jgi:hypothetical protein